MRCLKTRVTEVRLEDGAQRLRPVGLQKVPHLTILPHEQRDRWHRCFLVPLPLLHLFSPLLLSLLLLKRQVLGKEESEGSAIDGLTFRPSQNRQGKSRQAIDNRSSEPPP